MMRFVVFFSLRVLRGKGGTNRYLRGAVIGIAISLVPLIVVMEVSTGMIDGITARLLEVGTYHLQIALPGDTSIERLGKLGNDLLAVPGVVAAVPERQGTALLVSSHGAAGVSIRFLPQDAFARDAGFRSFMTLRAGNADLAAADSLLASSAMARTLGIKVGDRVTLLTTFGEDMSGLPRLTPLTVSGIYGPGYQELDVALAYAPLALADRVLSPRAMRTMIGIKVSDPFADLTAVSRGVAAKAGGSVRVATWRDIESTRLGSFATTKALLLLIMALVVVVASVNVSSAVLMILFERRYDLGILKSVGASPRSLALSFLCAGFATGLLGTVVGIAAALLVAVNINEIMAGLEWIVNQGIALAFLLRAPFDPGASAFGTFTLFNSAYYLKSIPIRINPGEVVGAAIAALALSAAASYFPAARAARTRPLEVLRKV